MDNYKFTISIVDEWGEIHFLLMKIEISIASWLQFQWSRIAISTNKKLSKLIFLTFAYSTLGKCNYGILMITNLRISTSTCLKRDSQFLKEKWNFNNSFTTIPIIKYLQKLQFLMKNCNVTI